MHLPSMWLRSQRETGGGEFFYLKKIYFKLNLKFYKKERFNTIDRINKRIQTQGGNDPNLFFLIFFKII